MWAGVLALDATTTDLRYDWLKKTLTSGIEETAAFAAQLWCKSRNSMGRFHIIILVRLGSFFSREMKLPLTFHGLSGRSKGKKQRKKPPG
jgi:hypothetical protein